MADLFSDGFEAGNTSKWTTVNTDAGDLSVTTAAKLHGSYGLAVYMHDTNKKYVQIDHGAAKTRYRCRFYFHPNTCTFPENGDLNLLTLSDAGWVTDNARVFMRWSTAAGYRVQIKVKTDGGAESATVFYNISNAPHFLEFDFKASTAPGANNGYFSMWIDGILQDTLSSVDNDTRTIQVVTLGPSSANPEVGTNGTVYFDDFAANDDGGMIGGLVPTPIVQFTTMGMNLSGASGNVAPLKSHIADLLNLGMSNIRMAIENWNDAVALADSKTVALAAIAAGANIVWGVGQSTPTITAANWSAYSDAVLNAATWAQANGVYEFQLGNEEENHNDNTTLTDAQLITNLKALATSVKAIFTRGNVSYACFHSNISDWVSVGKGNLDLLASNIYIGSSGAYSETWKTEITNLISLGAGSVYVSEFNVSSTSLADYSSVEVAQAAMLSRMIEYMRTAGITKAYYFKYDSANFGALNTTGVYRQLWQLMNFPSGRPRLTSTLGGISRTQSADRNVAIDLTQTITPVLGAEMLTDPGLEGIYTGGLAQWVTPTGTPTWAQSADVHGGSKAQQFVATNANDRGRWTRNGAPDTYPGTAGTWYLYTEWAKRTVGTASGVKIAFFSPTLGVIYGSPIISATYAQLAMCIRLPASENMQPQLCWETVGAGDTVIIDDGSLKPLTLSSLVGASQTASSQGTFQRPVTVASGYQAGFWMNWDGNTDGTEDYVEAIVDRALGTARLSKCVNGTITNNLVSGAITYVAGAVLKVVREASLYSLYYNGVLVGSAVITDGSTVGNTGFAAFQTDPNASGNIQYIYSTRTVAGARTAV